MLSDETVRHARDLGIPETDIAELNKFTRFLRARKEYRKAKDENRVTDQMRREYLRMIADLSL
jgi:hypothetical protein